MKRISQAVLIMGLSILLSQCLAPSSVREGNHYTKQDLKFMIETYGKFVESIPVVELPITMTCSTDLEIKDEELMESWKPFQPAGYDIIGRLESTKYYHFILCREKENPSKPILQVMSNIGSEVNLIKLSGQNCEDDPNTIRKWATTIKKDYSIQFRDTTKFGSVSHANYPNHFNLDSMKVVKTMRVLKRNGYK